MTPAHYQKARQGLIEKDLIDFNGTLFQVLDLPASPGGQLSVHPDIGKLCKNLFQEV